MNIQHYYWHV